MKRGSMIVVVVAIACNPWRLLTQAIVFVEVFAVFAGKLAHDSLTLKFRKLNDS